MQSNIVIGSRKSDLALAQTRLFQEQMKRRFPELTLSVQTVVTSGDRDTHTPLHELGGKFVFIKELEVELLKGNIDLAVHSLKDMPHPINDKFILPTQLKREDPRDAFLSNRFSHPKDLPAGAKVGTSSLRRKFQFLKMRPDCEIVPVRGNIRRRIEKLDAGEYDAILLANAGLIRSGLKNRAKYVFSPKEMVPAVGQGIITAESRFEDVELVDVLTVLDCPQTRILSICERAFLASMGGNCQSPIGGHAEYLENSGNLLFTGYFYSQPAQKEYLVTRIGPTEDADEIGLIVAEKILSQLSEEEKIGILKILD